MDRESSEGFWVMWRSVGELGVAGFAKGEEALVFSRAQGFSLWFSLAQVW